jgi:hypothetical protein
MDSQILFALSLNGKRITYDPAHSHASTHFADTPQIRPYVKQIIEQTDVSGKNMEFDVDTGVILGMSDLVVTEKNDEIVYAIRKNRDRHMRFTKSQRAQPSSMIAISLTRLDDNTYDLYSAWLGTQTPPTPNSPHANLKSKPFWSTHALVWGTQKILPGTETTRCPW